MAERFLDGLSFENIEALTGDYSQIAGIRKLSFGDGRERGMSVLQMHNAAGLSVDILPDRCFDIGQLWFEGIPLAWIGPNGLPPKKRASCFDAALGGMLTTCGFDHIRQPELHNGKRYPMHGSLALEPGKIIRCETNIAQNGSSLQIEGSVNDFSLKQGGIKLVREIEVPVAGNSISIDDKIEVIGSTPMAIMGLYHFNFGFPLISETSLASIEVDGVITPVAIENEIHIYPLPQEDIIVHLENQVGSKRIRVSLHFSGFDLPYLQTFGLLDKGTNLFCLEPTTHDRKPRIELEKSGKLDVTKPGQSARNRVVVAFLSD